MLRAAFSRRRLDPRECLLHVQLPKAANLSVIIPQECNFALAYPKLDRDREVLNPGFLSDRITSVNTR